MKKYYVHEMVIDDTILRSLYENDNKEFEDFFVNNFKKILDNSSSFNGQQMAQVCDKKPNIRKVIFDNLSDVFKKMPERASFINVMNRDEILEHIRDFFVEDLTGECVRYGWIIFTLELSEKKKLINPRELLNIIYDFIENIIKYGDVDGIIYVLNYIKANSNKP